MFNNKNINIKLAIIGSVGVGKSSIINRFIKDEFDTKINSTLGANYSKKNMIINDKNITLDIWDTAGQEKFHSMGRHFYANSHIIIIVYDITNRTSFEDIKTHWYNDILEYAEKYKVLGFVGNKYDLYDNQDIEEIDDNTIKDFIDAISWENDNPIINMKVSAKTGVNIARLFQKLVYKYLEKEYHILIKNETFQRSDSFNLSEKKIKKKDMKKCC